MELSGKTTGAIIAVVVIVLGGVFYALTKPKAEVSGVRDPKAAPSVAPPGSGMRPGSGAGSRPGGPSGSPSAAPPAG